MKSNKSSEKRQNTVARREFLLGSGAALIGAGAGSKSASAQARSLVFVGFGGSGQEHYNRDIFDDLSKELGMSVVNAYGVDMAKLKAQVTSGRVEWDVMILTAAMAFAGQQEGLLEPLDYGVISNANSLIVPKYECAVPFYMFSGGLIYDPKVRPTGTQANSWADFWDIKKFPGRRGLRNRPDDVLEIALLADGVKPADLYPLDVDRAFRSLDKVKSEIKAWIAQTGQTISLVRTGELDYSYGSINTALEQQASGVSIAVADAVPIIATAYLAIAKGSKNRDLAMKFVNGSIAAKGQASLANNYPGAVAVHTGARSLITPTAAKFQPDLNAGTAVIVNDEWWYKNSRVVNDRFKAWLLT